MFYKCPECSKIFDGYIKKCPECGSQIEMTDSVSDAEVKNLENAEENEEKFDLFEKRIKYGYIVTAVYCIVSIVLLILVGIVFDIPAKFFVAVEPVLAIILAIILMVIYKKCHFFACPHCDHMMKSHNALYSLYCPYCGKKIRK